METLSNGSGEETTNFITCPDCCGDGTIEDIVCGMWEPRVCQTCYGSGEIFVGNDDDEF